jgi:hypothetical protein
MMITKMNIVTFTVLLRRHLAFVCLNIIMQQLPLVVFIASDLSVYYAVKRLSIYHFHTMIIFQHFSLIQMQAALHHPTSARTLSIFVFK